jgi:quinol monooxygenase YgiN
MERVGIFALLEAKAGKEKEVEQFLKSAAALVEKEPLMVSWYAIKLGPSTFAIFDTFADEQGREAHLQGEIAQVLLFRADELLAHAPAIGQAEILAVKAISHSDSEVMQ